MATFYTDSNERVAAPMLYLREHLPSSYHEIPVLPDNMMLYMNSASCSDTLSIDLAPQQLQQQQEVLSNFNGLRIEEQNFTAFRDFNSSGVSSSSILQNGLSLSLGMQIPGGFQMSSAPYQNTNMSPVPFMSLNPLIPEEGRRSGNGGSLRNAEYVPHSYPGSSPAFSTVARTILNSHYLKAAQQILDEVVNVRKALEQPGDAKDQSADENRNRGRSSGDAADGGAKNDDGNLSAIESSASKELSHSERQELQNKLTKLLSMLDEVDKKYRQYYHQMQIVASSFTVTAGPGAAKPYTALALQRISRHFRCLRDAINGQISATQKDLGEQDSSSGNNGIGIARLRYIDQQPRQQRALQQFGMMQHHAPWRPQRGLPESSVSILRAWLFEHFLHPYPKDMDKIMLARQTGLSRSQVSNWFINARVRLWKPMIEEMYKEEIGNLEMDSDSSSGNAVNTMKGNAKRSSEGRDEDNLQKTAITAASVRCNSEPRTNHDADMEIEGPGEGGANFSGAAREIQANCYVQSSMGNARFASGAGNEYRIVELGRFEHGTGVSLTLGLQHFEGGTIPFSSTTHHGFVPVGGDDFYGGTSSSMVTEATEFEVISNPGNQPNRLGPGQQLMQEFVA